MTKLKWCIKRTPENADELNVWAYLKYNLQYIDAVNWMHSEVFAGSLLEAKPRPGFHEITIQEFRLLTNPDLLKNGVSIKENDQSPYYNWKPGIFQTSLEPLYTLISVTVYNELRKLHPVANYSDQPEVTTTLDPVTKYQTKGPDGTWSFDFKEETNCEAVMEATQKYAENLKEKYRKKAMIAKIEATIKVQKKALRELKELRDQLNAEVNY